MLFSVIRSRQVGERGTLFLTYMYNASPQPLYLHSTGCLSGKKITKQLSNLSIIIHLWSCFSLYCGPGYLQKWPRKLRELNLTIVTCGQDNSVYSQGYLQTEASLYQAAGWHVIDCAIGHENQDANTCSIEPNPPTPFKPYTIQYAHEMYCTQYSTAHLLFIGCCDFPSWRPWFPRSCNVPAGMAGLQSQGWLHLWNTGELFMGICGDVV